MNITIFSFWKHGKYAQRLLCMQNFQIWLLERLQDNLAKQKKHKQNPKQCRGIEPQFYEELWKTLPNWSNLCPNHTPTKTNHKINHCQLAIIQSSQLLQSSHSSPLLKNLPFPSIFSNLHLVCNCGMGHQANFSPLWWSDPCSPHVSYCLKVVNALAKLNTCSISILQGNPHLETNLHGCTTILIDLHM